MKDNIVYCHINVSTKTSPFEAVLAPLWPLFSKITTKKGFWWVASPGPRSRGLYAKEVPVLALKISPVLSFKYKTTKMMPTK